MTLEEFMNQKALERGYEKIPVRYYAPGEDGERLIDPERYSEYQPQTLRASPAQWGEYQTYEDGGRLLQGIEDRLQKEYYGDPKNLIDTRQTPVPTGINIFNEGNAGQKSMIDSINSGDYKIVKVNRAEGDEEVHNYEVVDAKTGQSIRGQQVTPVDEANGIFEIPVDDPNSSGYFRNFVSTDPKGFINPIQSEQQSQYTSHANESLNFYKDSLKGLLTMAAMAATAGGAGAALGSATGLGNLGGNIALNTGINALKQGIDGQFNPVGLATNAALSYGMGGGFGGSDQLTADDLYTGQAMTNLASSDDVTRLADLVRAFENPSELTGPTIDVASNPTVELGNATVDESYGLPDVPKDLQNEAYLDPGLIDVAPENVTIGTPDATPYFDASPTFPTLNVSPEYDPSAYLPTNLGGYTGVPADLGGLDVPFNTTTPTDLSAGELTVTGDRPYVPFEEDFPLQTETTTETAPLTTPKILSNILKSTPSALPKAIASQQQSNLANILRGSQMPQTALPPIYKQANPFNFGQQATPVQDVSALAKLLRTA